MDEAPHAAGDESHVTTETPWLLFGPSQLPYRILLLAKMIDRATAQHVRATANLSLAEWRVLTHVDMIGQCRATEVASAAFVDRAEVSRAISSLAERGLVHRVPNPQSRKSSLISLTLAGKSVHATVRGERGQFFEQWLTDLDPQQRAAIDAGLRKMMQRIVETVPAKADSSDRDPV